MSDTYRADHVGSFLRPAEVKEARAAFHEGRLPLERLHHIEDRAIMAVLARQGSVGVDIFTDGELRRTGFQNDLMEAVEGFVPAERPAVVRIWQGPGGEPQEQGTRQVVGGNCGNCGDWPRTRRASYARTPLARSRSRFPALTSSRPSAFRLASPTGSIRPALRCCRTSFPSSRGRSLPW